MVYITNFLPMDEFESEKPNIVPLEGVENRAQFMPLLLVQCVDYGVTK